MNIVDEFWIIFKISNLWTVWLSSKYSDTQVHNGSEASVITPQLSALPTITQCFCSKLRQVFHWDRSANLFSPQTQPYDPCPTSSSQMKCNNNNKLHFLSCTSLLCFLHWPSSDLPLSPCFSSLPDISSVMDSLSTTQRDVLCIWKPHWPSHCGYSRHWTNRAVVVWDLSCLPV